MTRNYTGRCACGSVTFSFDSEPDFIATCHCLDCKKASGGESATFFGVPEENFALLSGAPKPFHYTAASGKGLDRNFCPECGARVFTTNLEGFPGMVFIQLGSMDDLNAMAPKLEMFTKRRLGWVPAMDLPQFTDMPG
nr:GFA family protein [uncultured Sphingomonas sp.]